MKYHYDASLAQLNTSLWLPPCQFVDPSLWPLGPVHARTQQAESLRPCLYPQSPAEAKGPGESMRHEVSRCRTRTSGVGCARRCWGSPTATCQALASRSQNPALQRRLKLRENHPWHISLVDGDTKLWARPAYARDPVPSHIPLPSLAVPQDPPMKKLVYLSVRAIVPSGLGSQSWNSRHLHEFKNRLDWKPHKPGSQEKRRCSCPSDGCSGVLWDTQCEEWPQVTGKSKSSLVGKGWEPGALQSCLLGGETPSPWGVAPSTG